MTIFSERVGGVEWFENKSRTFFTLIFRIYSQAKDEYAWRDAQLISLDKINKI